MTSRDFCYWLQGAFELHDDLDYFGPGQIHTIRKHLNMVFIHEIDPSFPTEQQAALDQAHGNLDIESFPYQNIMMKC